MGATGTAQKEYMVRLDAATADGPNTSSGNLAGMTYTRGVGVKPDAPGRNWSQDASPSLGASMRPDVFISAVLCIAVAIGASIFVARRAGLMWSAIVLVVGSILALAFPWQLLTR
jgi:hypothetical protein